MFEKTAFIEECNLALKETNPQAAIQEILQRAISAPDEIIKNLGTPKIPGIQTLFKSENLTILNFLWGPNMFLYPHNHEMWANIGMYSGREVNRFYTRHQQQGLEHKINRELNQGDVISLGNNVIHSVENPLDQISAGIHIYGGDFFGTPRREWDPETYEEDAYNFERVKTLFEESNILLQKSI